MEDYTDPFDHIKDYHADEKHFCYQSMWYDDAGVRIGYDLMMLEESGGLGNYPITKQTVV